MLNSSVPNTAFNLFQSDKMKCPFNTAPPGPEALVILSGGSLIQLAFIDSLLMLLKVIKAFVHLVEA